MGTVEAGKGHCQGRATTTGGVRKHVRVHPSASSCPSQSHHPCPALLPAAPGHRCRAIKQFSMARGRVR